MKIAVGVELQNEVAGSPLIPNFRPAFVRGVLQQSTSTFTSSKHVRLYLKKFNSVHSSSI